MDQHPDEEEGTATLPAHVVPLWACLLTGVAAAFVGLLPWLVTGLRLPVQNLWATDTTPVLMPRALLPFSQYEITLIIGVLVVGSVVAGLLARVVSRRLPRHGGLVVAVGVLLVQLVSLVQTAVTVRAGLRDGREPAVYLGALVGVSTLAVLVGALALGLVARAPRGGAVVGLSVGALALAPWLSGSSTQFDTATTTAAAPALVFFFGLLRWVPAVLVGVAIGWGGVRTVGRVLAAGTGLVLLWLVPALTTAISSAAGTRVLAHDQREMALYAGEVFVAASTTPALVLPPLGVALAVAVAVGTAVGLLRRRPRGDEVRPSAEQP
jgi:hypothetical protein